MIVTEADLRDQLRCPTFGARVVIPAGARLSPSATDFVNQWHLETVEQSASSDPSAPTDQPASSSSAALASDRNAGAAHGEADWDKESQFPVDFEGELPCCETCGTKLKKKPSHLTQLDAHCFAPKTHPRIVLRGRVDSLHALVLLIQRLAKQDGDDVLARDLGTVAAYCRELTSAEYNERQVAQLHLQTWDADRIHKATHDPLGVLGISHLTIDDNESELMHWLNVARTMSREIEVTAMQAFPSAHHPYGASICHAFNRLSSTFYFLQLRMKAGIKE